MPGNQTPNSDFKRAFGDAKKQAAGVASRNWTPALSCVTAPAKSWPFVYFEDEPGRRSAAKLLNRRRGARPASRLRYDTDSINARSASGLRIMVQRFFNSMMP